MDTLLLDPLTGPHATRETATAAVRALNDQARADPDSIGDFLWDVFTVVVGAAQGAPAERQGTLIEFLVQLRQTAATDANGQPLAYCDGQVWKDMPSFGWVVRDRWNFGALVQLTQFQKSTRTAS